MPRPLLCPICKSPAHELARTGDATGFGCATYSAFKVANTVFAEQRSRNYSREQWEAALRKAKQRTKPGEWPVITSNDFWSLRFWASPIAPTTLAHQIFLPRVAGIIIVDLPTWFNHEQEKNSASPGYHCEPDKK